MTRTVRIGVLSIQGAFSEHVASLQKLSKELKSQSSDIVVEGVQVRTASQISLDHLDGLIIPGGESTTMALVATRLGLWDALVQWTRSGNPTWGTCAGLILLANGATHTKTNGQALLGGLDISVDRNYYGSQADSFVHPIHLVSRSLSTLAPGQGAGAEKARESASVQDAAASVFHGVFIRAPMITEILDNEHVQVLATLPVAARLDKQWTKDPIVAVQQKSFLATCFHPELTQDTRFHAHFLNMILCHRQS